MTWLIAVGLIVGGYEFIVRREMKKPVAVKYNSVVARVLRAVLPKTMRALSAWRTVWLLYPPTTPQGKLSITGKKHEVAHIESPNQWAGYPRTFPFRYLWESRKGYACNKYEEEARRIAGQPTRCGQ